MLLQHQDPWSELHVTVPAVLFLLVVYDTISEKWAILSTCTYKKQSVISTVQYVYIYRRVSIMQEPFLEGVPKDIPRLANKVHTWAIIVNSTWVKKSAAKPCYCESRIGNQKYFEMSGFQDTCSPNQKSAGISKQRWSISLRWQEVWDNQVWDSYVLQWVSSTFSWKLKMSRITYQTWFLSWILLSAFLV